MFKRVMDVSIALLLLLALSLPMLIVAMVVRWKMGAPVLFRQTRPGRNREPFELMKFRTMNDATDSQGSVLPDEARLTPAGRWLRRLSLDELPQLFNVLRGDMSLVGPRPLLMEYLPVHAGTGAAPRGAARRHRLGAGQRTQCGELGGTLQARCVVCGPSVILARSAHTVADVAAGAARGRYQRTRSGDDEQVYRQPAWRLKYSCSARAATPRS